MIDPDFWDDSELGEESSDLRLLYIASWNAADDEWRMRDDLKMLRRLAFGFRPDVTMERMEALRKRLISLKKWVPYKAEGGSYVFLKNMSKHQVVNRPSPSKLPPPPVNSLNSHGGITEDSRLIERKLIEEKGIEEKEVRTIIIRLHEIPLFPIELDKTIKYIQSKIEEFGLPIVSSAVESYYTHKALEGQPLSKSPLGQLSTYVRNQKEWKPKEAVPVIEDCPSCSQGYTFDGVPCSCPAGKAAEAEARRAG